MSSGRIDRIRRLVHHLDELEEQRAKIDAEIAETMRLLDQAPSDEEPLPLALRNPETVAASVALEAETRTKADVALEAVHRNPKITYRDLAFLIYGEDNEPNRDKARSVMYFLMRKAKKVRRNERTETWEMISETSAEADA